MLIGNLNKRIFFNKYRVQKLIYKSSLCLVYEGINMKTHESVAMKFERIKSTFETLEAEAYNLITLKGYGIPNIITFGKSGIFNILIEELLGPSLKHIWNIKKIKDKKILLKNCMISIQVLDRLEYIHSKNIIHRDIKPDNFLIGKKDPSIIYLIDFGVSHQYRSSRTGKHIKYQNKNRFFGSIRYMSLNANRGYELSRRDDLESFGYILVNLANDNLPWIFLETLNLKKKKYIDEVLKIKSNISLSELCKGLPEEFLEFIKYSRELKFEEEPDYKYLRGLFTLYLSRNFETMDYLFFWINALKKDNISERKNNFILRKNSGKKRLYNKIKNSLEKSKSEQQILNFKFNLDKIEHLMKKPMSKDNKTDTSYINEKKIIAINNYNIIKINNQFNNNYLTDTNDINTNIKKSKIVEKFKRNIDHDNNRITEIYNNKQNYLKIKNNKSSITNKEKSRYVIKNLYANKRIILTDNYSCQNKEIKFKEKNNHLVNLSNINVLKSIELKTDIIYKTIKEREKLKKLKFQKSADNNLKYNKIKQNKNLLKKHINNKQQEKNINNNKKIKNFKNISINKNKSNNYFYLNNLNSNSEVENINKNNSYIFNNLITINQFKKNKNYQ